MKCTWTNLDERLYDRETPELSCDNEATHNENCTYVQDSPVCAEHRCRCSITLEEAARRKAAKLSKQEAAQARWWGSFAAAWAAVAMLHATEQYVGRGRPDVLVSALRKMHRMRHSLREMHWQNRRRKQQAE